MISYNQRLPKDQLLVTFNGSPRLPNLLRFLTLFVIKFQPLSFEPINEIPLECRLYTLDALKIQKFVAELIRQADTHLTLEFKSDLGWIWYIPLISFVSRLHNGPAYYEYVTASRNSVASIRDLLPPVNSCPSAENACFKLKTKRDKECIPKTFLLSVNVV